MDKKGFFIPRGERSANRLGTLILVGLRSIEPLVQCKLLTGGAAAVLTKFGIRVASFGNAASSGLTFNTLPLPHLMLLGMSASAAAKHIYARRYLAYEPITVPAALTVGISNIIINGINAFLLVAAVTSSAQSPCVFGKPAAWLLGPLLYAMGLVVEIVAEVQRRRFKQQPANKGKVMRSGLWSLARHINYGGYTMWRAGAATTAGGFAAGGVMGFLFGRDMAVRAVPELDEYCASRYTEQWVAFKRDVRYVLLPWIY